MPPIGLNGERARLVPPDRSLHIENALTWLNDPELTGTLKRNFGIGRREEEAFFDCMESARDRDFWWAILDEAGRHIGFIGLHLDHWKLRSARGGLFIGERDCWG